MHVVSFLVNELFAGCFGIRSKPELYMQTGTSVKPWNSNETYVKRASPVSRDEQALVFEWARRAERSGSDCRLDLQQPFRVKAWPRAGIRSGLWTWQIVHGYRWADGDAHINLFELLALVNCVKWRLRRVDQVSKRFLHLSDSQVVVSVCAKGRTSSKKLLGTLKRYNSLLLAAQLFPMYAFTASADNPSDRPSRWARGSKVKRTAGRSGVKQSKR